MIQWIVKAAMFIVPILMKFIEKHSDTWLEGIYKHIEKKLGLQAIKTTLTFINEEGIIYMNPRVEFEDDTHGRVSVMPNEVGDIVLEGFRRGEVEICVYVNDRQKYFTIEIGDKEVQRIIL